jgi:peptidoglycan/LPS O-acetylase OafA/YrhL
MGEKAHLAYLDGWRGLAILMVLVAHFGGSPGVDLGRFGVDLFFVLSGLLMSRILFEERMPIGLFYRRRISRIIPAFLLFVIPVVLVFNLSGRHTSWSELVALLTFTRTYWPQPGIWHSAAPVQHLWSLNVEEHCYVVLAALASIAAFARGKRVAIILGCLSAGTLFAVALHLRLSNDPSADYLLNTECASTGLLASAAYGRVSQTNTVPPWAGPLALVCAFICYLSIAPWWARVAIAPFFLAFSVHKVGWLRRPLETPWLAFLGLISYSVYLWQQPFYKFPLPYRAGLPCTLVLAACSFYLFESPTRRWLNAHWKPAATTAHARIAPQ